MTEGLHLSLRHREKIKALLRKHLPGVEVWAYGSRVNGRSHDGSDLDLVLRDPELAEIDASRLAEFTKALRESTVPFLIEARDWARLPESFRREIEREHVVMVGAEQDSGPEEIEKKDAVGDWSNMPFSDAVLVNPPVPLERGKTYPFVEMVAVNAESRSAYSSDKRDFRGGGSRFENGDTLMARITPCLENGKVARYRTCSSPGSAAHGSTEFIVIRGRPGVTDPAFSYYLTQWEEVRNYAIGQMTGTSGRQRVPTESLDHLTVSIPSLPEQCAIAHILGTLDDKIELNRRMNETLEAMARALFKSWFVDFDPVRAKMKGHDTGLPQEIADLFADRMVESELGEIPEGWRVADIESLCVSITSGGTPARKDPIFWKRGAIPWYKTGELLDGPLIDSEEYITETAISNSSTKLWPAGTILFALYASPTVGRLGVLAKPGTANQAVAGLIVKSAYGVPFLRRMLIEARGFLRAIAVGAAQQNINQRILKTHRLIVPKIAVAGAYSRLMATCDEQQVVIAEESRTLAGLRDALLPKLVSGELRMDEENAKDI